MPLEIRAIKRKSAPEEIPEQNKETAVSQDTSSTEKDSPPSKKNKKTLVSKAKVETQPEQVLASENTVEKHESPLKSETNSSKQTAKSKKSAKKTKIEAVANPEITAVEQKPLDSSDSLSLEPSPSKAQKTSPPPATFFQAIGFIQGVIVLGEDGRIAIQIGSNTYKIYAKSKLLKKLEIGKEFLLRVYPTIANQKQVFGFNALSCYTDGPEQKIKPEDAIPDVFTLRGIWQFFGQSQYTTISIFRNEKRYPQDRCKPTHLPVSWQNSPVPPFRIIPNLTKEDKNPERYFVQIQAKFLPEEGLFVFDSLLAEPTQKIPKYIKEIKPDEKTKREQPIDSLDSTGNAG
ncbi:MAG: hypothetical protein VKL42_20940 [Snowella sp.]|nr:hypothetical protein [Snowella sp.]